jgi:hypothetical protein
MWLYGYKCGSPTGLLFVVDEIRPFPVWSNFLIFHQKCSKIDHFSFYPTALSFAIVDIRPLPVRGNFWDFPSKIIKTRPF